MKSIRVNISSGSHLLDVDEAGLFGLSLIRENNITSGIHFTECVFNPKGGKNVYNVLKETRVYLFLKRQERVHNPKGGNSVFPLLAKTKMYFQP